MFERVRIIETGIWHKWEGRIEVTEKHRGKNIEEMRQLAKDQNAWKKNLKCKNSALEMVLKEAATQVGRHLQTVNNNYKIVGE